MCMKHKFSGFGQSGTMRDWSGVNSVWTTSAREKRYLATLLCAALGPRMPTTKR